MHVVLIEPEIPQNTGSIARVCAGTGCDLHLVGKLGFSLEDRYLKRAGLDYWPAVKLHLWASLDELRAAAGPGARFHFYSARASKRYSDASHEDGDYLVFGKETVGLPKDLCAREDAAGRLFAIPHASTIRSLNLSNAVSVVLYEALRQTDFAAVARASVLDAGAENAADALVATAAPARAGERE